MAWVKIDDQFFLKPRARQAGKDGRALFWAGLCYCAANRTDGRIVKDALPLVAAMAEVEQDIAHLLVNVGLWTQDDEQFHVVDFLKFNPSREQLEAEAAAAAERQSRARSRRESHRDAKRGDAVSPPDPSPLPVPLDQSSSSSSSSDLVPDEVWDEVGRKKLAAAKAVGNPRGWVAKVIANAKADSGEDAAWIWSTYRITPAHLADVIVSGNRSSLANLPKREDAA